MGTTCGWVRDDDPSEKQPMAGLKHWIRSGLRRLGYDVHRLADASSMEEGLKRHSRWIPVRTIIDVGASDGRWSRMALSAFPEASCLLVEAQGEPHAEGLDQFVTDHPTSRVVIAAAGDVEGEIHFDAGDPFGGVASKDVTGPHDVVVPMTTIDMEVRRYRLEGPFLLTLDTHGFEGPVLEGARATLAETSLLIVESYSFELMPGSMRFHELCAHVEGHGLRPIDLVDILRRPGDDALWQFDLFFARSDQPIFKPNSYL